jgi:hypothetical protein
MNLWGFCLGTPRARSLSMITRITLRTLTLLLAVIATAACGSGEEDIGVSRQDGLEVELENTSETALYVIDGSDTNESHRSTMYRLAQSLSGAGRKHYVAGVNGGIIWDRSDIARREWLSQTVCDDLRDGVTRIALAGYSRGAILVLAGIGGAQDLCPEYDPMSKVVWVGLLDAVDTGIGWQLGLYTKYPALKVPSIHVFKAHVWEHVVTTKMLADFSDSPFPGVGHQELGGAYYYAGESKPNAMLCRWWFFGHCGEWVDSGVRNGARTAGADEVYERLRNSAISAGVAMDSLPHQIF